MPKTHKTQPATEQSIVLNKERLDLALFTTVSTYFSTIHVLNLAKHIPWVTDLDVICWHTHICCCLFYLQFNTSILGRVDTPRTWVSKYCYRKVALLREP